MIANISDRKDTIFLSNNNVFSLEIKFSWLKKASLLSFELHLHKILFVVSTFWNHIMFSKMKCSQIKRIIAHSITFCGFQMLKTLNLRYFLLPQNLHNHFSTVLSKTNWNTTSCKYSRCISLTSIVIPEFVEQIGNSAFDGCSSLALVTSLAITPPTLFFYSSPGHFEGIPNNAVLKVPTVEAYKNSPWSWYFKLIEEIPSSGIADVITDAPDCIFDLTGRRINKETKGQIYIKNGIKYIAKWCFVKIQQCKCLQFVTFPINISRF